MGAVELAMLVAMLVATIALVLTMINLWLYSRPAAGDPRRTSAEDLAEVGQQLEVVRTLTGQMAAIRSDRGFEEYRQGVESAAKRLAELRLKTRYPLWGLEAGFDAVLAAHAAVTRLKGERSGERVHAIVQLIEPLTDAIDSAIRASYFSGRPPSMWRRARVNIHARRVYELLEEAIEVPEPVPASPSV